MKHVLCLKDKSDYLKSKLTVKCTGKGGEGKQ